MLHLAASSVNIYARRYLVLFVTLSASVIHQRPVSNKQMYLQGRAGGSIDGIIRVTEANLARVTDKMVVIPGHGAIGDITRRNCRRKAYAPTDAKWGKGFRSPKVLSGMFSGAFELITSSLGQRRLTVEIRRL